MFKRFTNRKRLLTAAMLLCLCAFGNKAVGQTWDIGFPGYNSNVTATLSGNTLTISGSGDMVDFWSDSAGEAPWRLSNQQGSIQTVVFQSGSAVTNIGNRAFKDCINLTSITIPSSVIKINEQAFYNCTNLQEITIPNSVTTIEGEAFKNCSSLGIVTIQNGSQDLMFDQYYISMNIIYRGSGIGDWFVGCPLQTLHFGRNLSSSTAYNPFSGTPIQTLSIGNTVTTIGSNAFADCTGLMNVTFEDGSTTLKFGDYNQDSGATVFSGSPINTLYLGRYIDNNNSYSIFSSPFYNKTTLKTLTIGNNISITAYSFQNCINLQSVSIGNDVTSIGGYAFDGCGSLSSLIIGNSITSIGDAAFRYCSALTSINIPTYVSSFTIGNSSFASSGLTSIVIPNIVTTIGSSAFADCTNLMNVTFEDGSTTLKFGDYNQDSGATVFSGSPINTLYLGRYIDNNNDYSIFSSPFHNKTILKTLTIGKDMTAISDYAFYGCNGLTEITSNNPAPPTLGTYTFNGVVTTIPVKVPCVLAYQSSAWGTVFSNFEQTGICPPRPTTYTLNVLSSNTAYGHATSISMLSGAVLTSTWDFEGNLSTDTTEQFSGKAFLVASAKTNSVFLGWDDGNLEPMRIVDITDNKTYTAKFADISSLGTEEVQATTNISVYPNPAKDKVTVKLPENTVGTLALFDLNGKIIRNQTVNGNIATIDTASLSIGTYILRLVQNGMASSGVKIVKE